MGKFFETDPSTGNMDTRGNLYQLINNFTHAYRERTAILGKPPIGETSVGQKLDAIIEMLRSSASVPADLALVKEELSIVHGLISQLANPPSPLKPLEVKFMFVVKDDNADVPFSLVLGDVTDAEGKAIPDAKVQVNVESTDESVVAVTFDADAKTGTVHFGDPGTATVTATVSSGDKLLGSGAADFTVTAGDPAAIASVALNFEGLTEA